MRRNAHDLTRLDLAQVLRTDRRQRARFGSDGVAAVGKGTDTEGSHAPRIAKCEELVFRAQHDRVGTARDAEHVFDAFEHRPVGLDDGLGHYFGIRARQQRRRGREVLTQFIGVGEIAVVREREVADLGRFEQRLRVDDNRRTGGGVARVTDSDVAGELGEQILVENRADQAHVFVRTDRTAVGCCDARGLLSTVLKRIKPEIR